jgi:hypothetical protein
MKTSPAILKPCRMQARTAERARVRIVLLVLICFVLGIGAGAYWYRGAAKSSQSPAAAAPTAGLSEVMTDALKQLDAPVEIRFYAPASKTTLPEPLQAFAGRVDQLLAWYEQSAGGKIKVTRLDPLMNASAGVTAKADGIKPSPLTSGDIYYLALVVGHRGQKEMISPLAPEWEMALESDLSRAILRLASSKSAAQRVVSAPTADPVAAREVAQEIARAIPNLESVTTVEGTQMLRKLALEQCQASVREIQPKVDAAQQKLVEAQRGASEPDQVAAMKQFQQIQTEQTEKVKQITLHLQYQIAALEQLKAVKP